MTSILFADNDSDFLDTRAEFLEQAGYRVLKAYTLAQARQLLAEARIHLAVLDIRMENDEDDKDVSGLTLAKDPAFRPIPKIILTGFPTYQAVREALGPALDGLPPAVDFLAKQEGPEAFIQAVERAFKEHVHINWGLVIRLDERASLSFPHLVSLLQPEAPPERLADRVGELQDLFRKLFCDKCQITLGRILWHRHGRVCLPVFAYSPEGAVGQRLVICGMRSQIEQEMACYKRHAPKGGVCATLVSPLTETMHFAAMAYDLHEADLEQVQTFEAFYRANKTAQVREVVRHLFQTALAAWHQESRILEETRSLGQLYRERLGLTQDKITPEELQRRMQALAQEALSLGSTTIELSAQELTLRFPSSTVSYPNPLPRLYDEVSGQAVVCRITPGTLSGDNILVEQDGCTWLTDFAQAGPAPLLWDFVSLEAIIRFDLVDTADLQALHDFETRLVEPARLNDRLDVQDIDPPLRKALEVIQEVRHLAFSAAGGDSIPYYQGLLFHAMSDVAGYAPELKHSRGELARLVHALLAAAMTWERLRTMSTRSSVGSASPTGAPRLEIDEPRQRARVGENWVSLSPSELRLLLYLYHHAEQPCTRKAIVEEAFGDIYTDSEGGRINTLVGRVRKKLEPDPEHPCYIRTVRGGGYMLCLGDKAVP